MSEALTLAGRCLRMNRRDPEALIMAILLPVMLMLVFVYFFGGAIDTGTAYVTYVVPGLLVLCAGYGSAGTAMRVTEDMRTGVVDRFRSMGVTGTPVLAGHVAASVVRNVLATAMVLSVAVLIGFRPAADPLAWLAAAGLLLAYLVAVSWLAAGVGLLARTPEGASGFTFFLMFLPYPSSAFVPIETMPTWLHAFAEHQPVTPLIESLRALLLDEPLGSAPWAALAWCGGILLIAVAASNALFRFRTR
ncbi:ABC transporter permease [Streptomyces sp. SID8014]|uniref:ABC transporter permease n=1 Tax=Streptomyces sp. SID8014 TaxID=2706097 RepID=UPI0013B6AA7C|nr:ABC transporter permease [Streptomyces sp. SID8014]NEC16611.1 ABC transporter permease [Streptomyces sp. SID8014]